MLIKSKKSNKQFYIVLISVHGLIRGNDMELGRDADTGGQTRYVVELATALAKHPEVEQVDLITRWISDPKVSKDYSVFNEELSDSASIVRLKCGPSRYMRKEALWPYLDTLSDQCLGYFRSQGRPPDIIHAHYADAGYVGCRLSAILGIPLVFTGHSLGRIKLKRLMEQGISRKIIEETYHIRQRIEAEEKTLDYAGFEVASTRQEVEEQYKVYDNYEPENMNIIPPGVNLAAFSPPAKNWKFPAIAKEIDKFLKEPDKPIIFALSRADYRKNIITLIEAYGQNRKLQKKANLLIVAGTRDDIQGMDKGTRNVLNNMLLTIDKYDLYGKVSIPKKHLPKEVPEIYRLVYQRKGVFINPALTEPFGLTLIEAAASGVPIVATNDGGPTDIIHYCQNGILIDPLNKKEIAQALISLISKPAKWRQYSKKGLAGVHKHFSWESHVEKYLLQIKETIAKKVFKDIHIHNSVSPGKSRMPAIKKIIISDVDNTLLGDDDALMRFQEKLNEADDSIGFGVATGRSLESTIKEFEKWRIPMPDVLFTSAGTEIYYAPNLTRDTYWSKHLDYKWEPDKIRSIMKKIPGVILQKNKTEQKQYKISYDVDKKKTPKVRELMQLFRNFGLHVNLILSHDAYLDILPVRASKGSSIRRFAMQWGIPFHNILVVGDSGNDEWMLQGDTLGVVVGNYSPELEKLKGKPLIYFAKGTYADGIIEGIDYYNFFGDNMLLSGGEEYD